MQNTKAKIGVFGIGLAAYWPQFEGLKERLERYQKQVEARIAEMGAEIVSAGLVDDAPGAREAGDLFTRENVDLIVCYVGTYSTSSQVLPAVQRRRAPVLILNLQPIPALDYLDTDTAEWLANCCACCVPEISNAFARSRIQFNVVSGLLSPADGHAQQYYERAWNEIEEWIQAASVMRSVSYSRIGFLGHTYPGMLDMYSDFTMHHAQLGTHIEVLEMDDLHKRVSAVTDAEISAKIDEIGRVFDIAEPGRDRISMPVTEEAMQWTARVAAGLDRLTQDFDLHGLTYYYRGLDGNPNEELGASLIVGNSLLTARGIPASGEGDLKTCVAMMMMDRFRAGGSYTEFYAMDFNEDFILMGHDGPGHIAISDEKPVLRGLGLYHGKRGYGISVEFKVRTGPITILAMTQTADGRLKMLAAEGESIPGDTMKIGNTNSRLKFSLDPAAFMNAWCEEAPTHHCALGIGHQLGRIRKLARLLNLELAVIG
ncbi:L-fucose/L-arabinose isomerase family protein [Geitlerinema calcuttense]|uniref:L-fucose/L-arabinose isomerase family protein n=1 Tax=Geitlerinema calcuttense NRMC-F 0142 TaxID=2922238 RepID=A0ABT7LW08_9CYAN|nr:MULTISPECIES: L-fucose/L-arabinose isomerase family protein [Cyanophyceae]MDL5056208.1 L-fucose/L-arabinose isomerase family protein [Geitlerinema calcuttense NRMC-F 0142]